MAWITFTERDRGDDERHGTPAGARRHSEAGEPPCEACRAAKSEYDRRYRAANDKKRMNRLHAKAQNRAERDLRRAHLDEYRALYLEHKRQLIAEHIRENGGAQ